MRPIEDNKALFICDAATQILAGAAADPSNSEGENAVRWAIDWAEFLWGELERRGHITEKKEG